MLGLPSTTELNRNLPKKAFYERFKVTGQLKDDFIHKIERIDIVHSIKASTTNIPEGDKVQEVMVLRVELRQREVPEAVLKFIAEHNQHKLVFVCACEGEACLAVLLKKLVVGAWQPLEGLTLDLQSSTMDAFWDSLASQIVYGDSGNNTTLSVEERFEKDQRIAALRGEIARIDKRCRKEKQISRKNELFSQVKKLKNQLAELENSR